MITNQTPPPMLVTKDTITVFIDGESHVTRRGQPNFNGVLQALKRSEYDQLNELFDIRKKIEARSQGRIHLNENGDVTYDGQPLHNYALNKLKNLLDKGLDPDPLLKFLDRLMKNPNFHCVEDLYKFLETEDLPITEDGCFLAYKAVKSNFKDKYTGKIDNSVGRVVTMPRNKVNDNRDKGCSAGLHAGSLSYVRSFGGGTDMRVIVKVDPQDVVCIPHEDCRKLRCCRYKVVTLFSSQFNNDLFNEDGTIAIDTGAAPGEDEDDFSVLDDQEELADFFEDDDLDEDDDEYDY